jgi:SAM-dependent methyltransferase
MFGIFKKQVKNILDIYVKHICKSEFESQHFTCFNERAVEFSFVFKHLAQIYPRKVLDVGTGITALPNLIRNCGCLVTAIDHIKDYWPKGMFNRHYYIINDDITNTHLVEKFDLITCVSVLEHIEKSDLAIANMFKLLQSGGYLVLTFPYTENRYIKDVYTLNGSSYGQNAPYICQSYSRANLNKWLEENNGELIDQELWRFWSGDYWTIGNQVVPPHKTTYKDNHQLTCVLIRKM